MKVCHHVYVNFDKELSEYKTRGGVHKSDDGSNQVTAPVNMWLKALDMCFEKLKIDGLDFSTVLGISGCAQQHGSVWWRRESSNLLANLNPDEYLHKELVTAFSLRDCPIWMDSSTTEECRQMEDYVGGPARLAQITGSRAYERFTGPQIARVFKHRRESYMVTERITLISNFLASIFCGSYAPLDASDASGMNMMDIRTKRWSQQCLEAIFGGDQSEVPGLRSRLGCGPESTSMDDNIVDSHEVVGRVSKYLIERYGFPPECLVSSFTGDNPGSMAGLCVGKDELIISLGTSDTAFFWLEHPQPGINGHVLRNPIDENEYMGLICFKNGSKTRERIRDQCAKADWDEFSTLLNSVPRGNFGNIGFYYDLREIYPLVSGDFRYNKLDQAVEMFTNELEIRACLEGQVMRLFHHSQSLGLDLTKINRVLVTGGASTNKAILQVIADVFHTPVYTLEELSNSACLGGAYLAKYAYELEQQKLDQSFKSMCNNHENNNDDERAELEKQQQQQHFQDQMFIVNNYDQLKDASIDVLHDELRIENNNQQLEQQQQQQHDTIISEQQLANDIKHHHHPHNHLEKQVDFSEMVLGSDEADSKTGLVKIAEPTPVASQGDVYKSLLERYVKLETEISINNDPTL